MALFEDKKTVITTIQIILTLSWGVASVVVIPWASWQTQAQISDDNFRVNQADILNSRDMMTESRIVLGDQQLRIEIRDSLDRINSRLSAIESILSERRE